MKSTNAPPARLNSSEISEVLDPIEIAAKLAQQFSALSADLTASGLRDRFAIFLQGNFRLGAILKENPEAYRRFKDDVYWRDVRQKPNKRNVMRSVLTYTMRSKGRGREATQNRIYKYARVLEYFYPHEVMSDDVPQRLKEGGGIDAIYARLCREARQPEGGVGLEETITELPRTGDGATDTRAVAVQARSVPLLTAANDAPDALRGEVQAAGAPKRGPRDRINLYTTLAVEMSEWHLKDVLQAKRATIRVTIGPRYNRDWTPVRAVSYLTSNSTEGPWPGQSVRRDDDEQR